MPEEILKPNGDEGTNNWSRVPATPLNAFSRVDDGVATPDDGTTYLHETVETEEEIFDLEDSALGDGDEITRVDINFRAWCSSSSSLTSVICELIIGGARKSSFGIDILGDSQWRNYSANHSNWNIDWTASELDGMQISMLSDQGGKPSGFALRVTAIEAVVTTAGGGGSILPMMMAHEGG